MNTLQNKASIILICCSIFFACKPNAELGNDVEIIDVESNLTNYSSLLRLADIVTEVEYIALESTHECLLTDIRFVDFSKMHILVQARGGVYLFNRKGKFLREISKKGRGPFEYSLGGISRLINDSIFIPTIIPRSEILIFNVLGERLSSIPVPENCFHVRSDNWFYTQSSVILQVSNYSGKEKNRLIQLNLKGDTVKTYPNTTFFNGPAHNGASGTALIDAQFYSFNNNIMYKEVLIDTLWHLTDSGLTPRYVFKRGSYGIPTEYRGLSLEEYQRKTERNIDISKILESNDYVFFKIWLFKNNPFKFRRAPIIDNFGEHSMPYPVLGCYNKKAKHTFIVKPTSPGEQPEPTGIYNDFDGGINFLPNNAINEKEFISWFEAFDLKNYITTPCFKNSTPKYPEKKRELEQLANSLNDNDNPVLMLVKLKE